MHGLSIFYLSAKQAAINRTKESLVKIFSAHCTGKKLSIIINVRREKKDGTVTSSLIQTNK
jgi:hypothetical protein